MAQKLLIVLVIIGISFVYVCSGKALLHKRAIAERNADLGMEEGKRLCLNQTPCGWAVYSQKSRQIDYFMKNSRCHCMDGFTCGRSDEDLSISAFVYRCLNSTQAAANQHDPYAFNPKTT